MAKPRLPAMLTATPVPHVENGIYVGLDQSFTGTGVVAFDQHGAEIAHTLISTKPGSRPIDEVQRFVNIWTQIHMWVTTWAEGRQVCVVMEDFAFSQVNQMAALGGLGWHLRIQMGTQTDWHFGACPTGTLKCAATGKGNSPKEVVMMGVFKRWGFEAPDNNVADAYVLGKLAWVLYAKPPAGAVSTRVDDFKGAQKIKVYR